jgi:tRNA A37 methylthiotransferase MiaB
MSNQVPKSLRRERVARLAELENNLRRDYFQRLVGRRLELLVESSRPLVNLSLSCEKSVSGQSVLHRGTTCRYAPAELNIDAAGNAATDASGQLTDVLIVDADSEKLIARSLNDSSVRSVGK